MTNRQNLWGFWLYVIAWIIGLYFRIRNHIKFGKIDTSEYDKMINDLVQEVTGVPDYLLPPPPCGKGEIDG